MPISCVIQAMKESFTINKPHIAEDFVTNLMGEALEQGSGKKATVTFPAEHLNSCLSQLATDVMTREKHNYERWVHYDWRDGCIMTEEGGGGTYLW